MRPRRWRRTEPGSAARFASLMSLGGLALLLSLNWFGPTPASAQLAARAEDRIAVSSEHGGNDDIYVVNGDGSGLTQLTSDPGRDTTLSWSPDGSRIAFVSERSGNFDIYVMNADGSGLTRLTDHPAHDDCPSWSPDGRRIAFCSQRDGAYEVYLMNADGTGQTAISNHPAVDVQPNWAPDGSQLVFQTTRDGNPDIYVMNADGSGQRRLTSDPGVDQGGNWSPDGKRIAFSSGRDGNREIYVMQADGSGQIRLTYEPAEDICPSWTPDGRISFHTHRGGGHYTYLMNADGSEQTRILENTPLDGCAKFRPVPAVAAQPPPALGRDGRSGESERSSSRREAGAAVWLALLTAVGVLGFGGLGITRMVGRRRRVAVSEKSEPEPASQPAPAVVDLGIDGFEEAVEVGRGGFGIVYRVRQSALNRQVAVKVLAGPVDTEGRERFAREGWAMGTLSGHPNIVNVLGTGTTASGSPYITMSYLPQGSLAARLRRHGPLPWSEAVRIAIKLAGALEAAHRAGTLHRDVKPENVLLSDYDEPLLSDFGIARVAGRFETSSFGVMASLAHAAPEVLQGGSPSVASDVYSLGSTIFALIAGRPAFVAGPEEALASVHVRIATDPVPDLRLRGVPDSVCRVIEAAMAKDPADRPPSSAEVGRQLQEAQLRAGLPVTEMAVAVAGGEVSDAGHGEDGEITEDAAPRSPE